MAPKLLRDAHGRFCKAKRRNLDAFTSGGVVHPIRGSKGYKPIMAGESDNTLEVSKPRTYGGIQEIEIRKGGTFGRRLTVRQSHKGAKTWDVEKRTISGASGLSSYDIVAHRLTKKEAIEHARDALAKRKGKG